MNRFTKYAIAAATLAAGALTVSAPASAQPYGYGYYGSPRGPVCDPYSRFYNAFACVRGPSYYRGFGGPVLSFNFGYGNGWNNRGWNHRGSWNNNRDWDRGNRNGGGRDWRNR